MQGAGNLCRGLEVRAGVAVCVLGLAKVVWDDRVTSVWIACIHNNIQKNAWRIETMNGWVADSSVCVQ